MAAAAALAILARAPSSGGKSRLFAELGRAPDPHLLEALLLDTLDGCVGDGWSRVVAVEPAAACAEVAALLPAGIGVMPQPTGTLGDRMRQTIAQLLAGGAPAVAVVGSDLPTVSPDRIARAWALLAGDPESLVLGPAADGGYYLLAATRVPEVFEDIAWGSDMVLAQTMAAAGREGMTVHLLDPLADLDGVADLERLCAEAPRPGNSAAPRGTRTRQWARRHLRGCGRARPETSS